MLTRRRFMELSGATALSSMCSPPVHAQTDEAFCAVIDDEPALGQIISSTGNLGAPFSIELRSGHPGEFQITEYGLSVAAKRWRRGDGRTPDTGVITLGVHFNNASAADRALVERGASAWLTDGIEKLIAFEFGVPQAEAQISILFGQGVNDSKIGRDSQAAARSNFSMRIHDRADYIVTHEFGHALCLKHEHQHPNSGIVWDKPKVIADLARLGVTDQAAIKRSIFDPLDRNLICATSPGFNAKSIMSYQILPGWDKNGFTSTIPNQLSDGDIACVYGLYHG